MLLSENRKQGLAITVPLASIAALKPRPVKIGNAGSHCILCTHSRTGHHLHCMLPLCRISKSSPIPERLTSERMNNNKKQPTKPRPAWLKVLVTIVGISLVGGVGFNWSLISVGLFQIVEEKDDPELVEETEETAKRAEALLERMEQR